MFCNWSWTRWWFASSATLMVCEVSFVSWSVMRSSWSWAWVWISTVWLVRIIIILRFNQSLARSLFLTFKIFLIGMTSWSYLGVAFNVSIILVISESVIFAECSTNLFVERGTPRHIGISVTIYFRIISIRIRRQIACLCHLEICWSTHFTIINISYYTILNLIIFEFTQIIFKF